MRTTSSRRKPGGFPPRMDRAQHTMRRNNCAYFLLSACFLAAVLTMLAKPASAQKIQEQVLITKVDPSAFPTVQVLAILRDRRGKPIPTGNLQNLVMVEKMFDYEEIVSDDLHGFTLNSISTGAEVLFVIDVVGDLSKPGASQDSYLVEMQNVIQSFINSMGSEDKAGLLVVTSSHVDYLQPLTADKELLNQGLKKIPPSAENISFGRYGIDRAVYELSISPGKESLAQAVVFMTPQLFHGDEGLENILAKAVEERITVHSVLTRDIEYSEAAEPLKLLAFESGGAYIHYRNNSSPQPIFDSLNERRTQTLMSFRSKLGDSSERTIELILKGAAGTFSDSEPYQISLQPPAIKILSPKPDEEITRQAKSSGVNMDLVEPTTMMVSASINWEDGFPRDIISAQLIVDGSPVSVRFTESPGSLYFEWDLRPYRESGIKLTHLSIQLQDELGLTGKSEETIVKVQVSVPETTPTSTNPSEAAPDTAVVQTSTVYSPAPTSEPAACSGLVGAEATLCRMVALGKVLVTTPSGWVTIGGLLGAIFAIIMAFRYRGPIGQAREKALGTLRETVTQLRRPVQADSGAFLHVLQGDEDLTGKIIPLYPHQATSIGRSLREVELAFQVNQERSVISRKHCEIKGEGGGHIAIRFKIIDLGSTHGTFVNGERLPVGGNGRVLSHEDQIELGPAEHGGVLLQFKMPRSKAETSIESPDSRPTHFGNL